MRIACGYTFFWGWIFSNFHRCEFSVDGIVFCSSEQYFMYQKALTFGDIDTAKLILLEREPKLQKDLGRKVAGFDDEIWKPLRKKHMFDGCYAKFSQNPELSQQLLATKGTTLVEASPEDTIWGIGLAEDDDLCLDPSNWLGLNELGETLCKVRDLI